MQPPPPLLLNLAVPEYRCALWVMLDVVMELTTNWRYSKTSNLHTVVAQKVTDLDFGTDGFTTDAKLALPLVHSCC